MFTTPLLRNECVVVGYCRDGLWRYSYVVYSIYYVVYLSRNGTRSLNCTVSAFASVHLLRCIYSSPFARKPNL